MEQYLTNYSLPCLQKLSSILDKDLLFVDLETTGMVHSYYFAIIEIGLVLISKNQIKEFSTLIDPGMKIPQEITNLTGISNQMVIGKKKFDQFVSYFEKIANTSILVGYNSKSFDSKGLEKMAKQFKKEYTFKNQLDIKYPFIRNRNETMNISGRFGTLVDAGNFHNIKLGGNAHRAGFDIALTTLIAESILESRGIHFIKNEINKIDCPITKDKFNHYLKINNL